MGQPLEVRIRKLQEFYWSNADPDGRGFVALADALRAAGDFMEAHRILRDGLARHPDYLSGHVVYAWLNLDQGKMDEAETWFRRALELDPRNLVALRGMADILQAKDDAPSALGFLEALLSEDPLDQELTERVEELKEQVDVQRIADADVIPDIEMPLWDDPDSVAAEVDWEGAVLQPDTPWADESREDSLGPDSVAVVEDGGPLPDSEDLEPALITSTLGEIYVRQGLYDRAESVFRTLLQADPDNDHLRHRLGEVQNLQQEQEAAENEGDYWEIPQGGSEDGVSDVFVGLEEPGPEDPAPGAPIAEDDDLAPEVVPIELLAPDRPGPSPGFVPDESVPVDPLGLPEPISIDDLAPDEPVSIDSLAPDEPVSIHDLAPDEPVFIEALAPDEPVFIEALAPDEPVQHAESVEPVEPVEPVSVDELAPPDPVSVDELAPPDPVSIDALAPPDPVPVDDLAPEEDSSTGDPTLDAFERWLDNLE